ncbi:OsmC family protein [Planctomicrobium sp. SH661]|uniref:OsmC family protein n=1 Tax=Planctomicrobium sp. SH661 TaxID=3448124 RepID=UPI003F5B0D65
MLFRPLMATGLLWCLSDHLPAQAVHQSDDWAQSPAALNEGNSLIDFQRRFQKALTDLKGEPALDQPLKLTANVVAESRTGIRRLRIRNFQILSDGFRETAEFELGPGSWPSLVGVLGSAVAGDFLTQAASKGIPIEELEVVFTSRPLPARSQATGAQIVYPQNLQYTAFIVSPASDSELEQLRVDVEKTSAVLNLVSQSQEIEHGHLTLTKTPAHPEGKTLAGLREFLEDKRAASQGALPIEGARPPQKRVPGVPPLRAHIKVEGGTGIRHIRTDDRNFQILHDYPRYLGGNNLGPIPEEHLLGTMITCLAHIYEIEAAKKQVILDTLELDVEGTLTTQPGNVDHPPSFKDIRYSVRIGSPQSRESIEELQRSVESTCPIFNMLKNSQTIHGSIVRGPYTPEKEAAAKP